MFLTNVAEKTKHTICVQ